MVIVASVFVAIGAVEIVVAVLAQTSILVVVVVVERLAVVNYPIVFK